MKTFDRCILQRFRLFSGLLYVYIYIYTIYALAEKINFNLSRLARDVLVEKTWRKFEFNFRGVFDSNFSLQF